MSIDDEFIVNEKDVDEFYRDIDTDIMKLSYPETYLIRSILIIQDRLKQQNAILTKILEKMK